MKQSVNFSDFCSAFHAHGRFESFGYDALRVIFDYLEQYEEDCNEEIELDVLEICCDYNVSDYKTIAQDYLIDLTDADGDEEDEEQIVLDYLNENTRVLGQCKDGIVYQCF